MRYNKGQGWNIIYADFPWHYTSCGTASLPYQCMPVQEIKDFPWEKLMADRCLVFLWVTCPLLLGQQADIVKAWEARLPMHFKGVPFVWVKTTKDGVPLKATGPRPNTVKPVTEFVACLGTHKKGRVLPLESESVEQVVFAPRTTHSSKPEIVRQRIDSLFDASYSRLELFSRDHLPTNWDGWGDQYPGPRVLPAVL